VGSRFQESQVESCEHQDNTNIHYQSFPESVSEEHEIYADYNGCHRHHVKHDSYLSAHFSTPGWDSGFGWEARRDKPKGYAATCGSK
jgi:hypothetical protein